LAETEGPTRFSEPVWAIRSRSFILLAPDEDPPPGSTSITSELPMADDDLRAEVERLRAENAKLKEGGRSAVRLKISEKGGLSVYGLGRFPVTLYKEQWTKLLAMADEIKAFLAEHDAELKTKGAD
jgi:hypothetical protein